GYLGGLQPRYYMSIITIIALYCAQIIESIDQPSKSVNISLNDKRISISYQSISIGVAALWLIGLFYDDFIYTLLTFKNYI
ncbi:MAG: hypothetical protein LBN22_11675, partial [Clostridiales Family XIII bacterium]|nr:hypothetical protein [Clostridiales Family XIII bacterium]